MSRVDPIDKPQPRQDEERPPQRDAIDRKPSKAEGEESTVDEALGREENRFSEP
ncbi:MAG TPA: hypothetical protein VGK31_00975 [Thermoanaerobaculia bacterium]|jgi:hypothetical protein